MPTGALPPVEAVLRTVSHHPKPSASLKRIFGKLGIEILVSRRGWPY